VRDVAQEKRPELILLNPREVLPPAFRVREGDESELSGDMYDLTRSVKAQGVLQPIVVRPKDGGMELVVGGRRLQAARHALAKAVPAMVMEMTDAEALEAMLVENVHRRDMSDVQKGFCLRKLMEVAPERYPSQQALGERVGKSQDWVSRHIQAYETARELKRMRPTRRPSLPSVPVPLVLLLVGLIVGLSVGAAVFSGPRGATTVTATLTSLTVSTTQPQDILEVCFSPGGNCASRIVYWLGRANTSVHVLIYSFTLDDVAQALIQAKNRGVDVKVVMDEENFTGTEYPTLRNAGIDVRIDYRSNLMHNKVAILDSRIVITGSFNWSAAANDRNRENLIVIANPNIASTYEQYFLQVWNASS